MNDYSYGIQKVWKKEFRGRVFNFKKKKNNVVEGGKI